MLIRFDLTTIVLFLFLSLFLSGILSILAKYFGGGDLVLEINWLKIILLVIFYAGMKLFVRSDVWYGTFLGFFVSVMALQILLERVHDL